MKKLSMPAVIIGMLLIAAALVIPFAIGSIPAYIKYIYAAGAVIMLIGRLANQYEGKNTRLRRLLRLEVWSAIIFCVAAFFLFYDSTSIRDALAFTLAGGLIQAYTSIMIPRIKDN